MISTQGLSDAVAKETGAFPPTRIPGSRWRTTSDPASNVTIRATWPNIINCIAWRSDSKRIAVLATDDSAVYNPNTGARITNLPRGCIFSSISYVPNSNIIASGGPLITQPWDPRIALTLLDDATGSVIRQIQGTLDPKARRIPNQIGRANENAPNEVIAVDWGSQSFVTAPVDGLRGLQVFDYRTWSVSVESLDLYPPGYIALRPNSEQIAVTVLGRTRVYSRRTGLLVKDIDLPNGIQRDPVAPIMVSGKACGYSPDGAFLVTANPSGGSIELARRALIYRSTDYTVIAEIGIENQPCNGFDFHPDGTVLAVGYIDEFALYDTKSFSLIHRFAATSGAKGLRFVSFSPDGGSLVVGSTGILSVFRV